MTSASAEGNSGDDRLIRETGIDARVASIILPVMETAGFRLVRVRLSAQNGATLQIMAERLDGTMTVEDCEELSRAVSPILDVEDPIDKAYHLEVSSPGIDRPLVRQRDFELATGHLIKMDTAVIVADRKRFRGKIVSADDNGVTILRDQASYGDEPNVTVPWDAISDARLILTDDLISETLKRDKQAKKLRGLEDDEADVQDEDENTN
ncbi:ribosome maturation factor RimP [Aerobium aerolatum]|uniref:Ribosome maturation factor RimP n=1 Tax=Aquamicrobium aerolatum DSM 21857 TaxID=1121003 RepID=A0A1I3LIX4_9HYPH|nr:ribosome maturation factor RimP [Aquamicrobium aerolatum]SFI84682.1 ribosome maturation factor RimP [Aquamicrobium aerolatum DSM 21857]